VTGRSVTRLRLALVLLLVAGCQTTGSRSPVASEPFFDAPVVTANGVAATAITYCPRPLSCAEGSFEPGNGLYLSVGVPIEVASDVPLSAATAYVLDPSEHRGEVAIVGVDPDGQPQGDLRIENFPAGDWDVLILETGGAAGWSATYAWPLAPDR
jgi:hypothetical protein